MKTKELERKGQDRPVVLSAEERVLMAENLFRHWAKESRSRSFSYHGLRLLGYAQEILWSRCEMSPKFTNEQNSVINGQKAVELLNLIPVIQNGQQNEAVDLLLKLLWETIFRGWNSAKVGSEQFVELSESLLDLVQHCCVGKDVFGSVCREAFRMTNLKDDSRQKLAALCAFDSSRKNVNQDVLAAAARAFVHNAIEDQSFRNQPSILANSFALVAEAMGESGQIDLAILPACRNFIAECAKLADAFSPLYNNHRGCDERNMDHGYWCECRGWEVINTKYVQFSFAYWPMKAESEAEVLIDTTIGVDVAKLKKTSPVARSCQVRVVCDIMPIGLTEIDPLAKPFKTIERIF